MADPALEKSTTQWRILMRYREVFLRHQSLLSFIDHAIEHVFDARNCADVDSCIQKVEDNTIRVRQLEADGFDTSAITIPLAELFALEAYEIFSTQIAEVQTLMDMRSRMAALSMSIGGIDRAIVGIFNVRRDLYQRKGLS